MKSHTQGEIPKVNSTPVGSSSTDWGGKTAGGKYKGKADWGWPVDRNMTGGAKGK